MLHVKNNHIQVQTTVKEFLLDNPQCPYTTIRSLNGKILLLREHIERLNMASQKLFNNNFSIELNTYLNEILNLYKTKGYIGDVMFVVLIQRSSEVLIYSKEFVPPTLEPCTCAMIGEPRSDPTIKNSSWVADREHIENLRPDGVYELLLSKDFCIYEGLITNFFGIVEKDDELCVMTCPFDSVLPGTIANLVIQVCNQNGIPFQFAPPNIFALKGGFLTNSLKWVQPIEAILLKQENEWYCTTDHRTAIKLDEYDIIKRISILINKKLNDE
jgi:branched-subunit amino acid aminotransferase/4-amino-4-deoxychorismate lyase